MKIFVTKKPLGRVRTLQTVAYELEHKPETVRALLRQIVAREVACYNDETLMTFLLDEHQTTFKFGPLAARKPANVAESIAIMEQAFEDGLFKVLQGQHTYQNLDENIISDEPNWTFIKLAFLTGRL